MCFITRKSILKRAEKDIVCYKIMDDVVRKATGEIAFFRSYYQDFEYKPEVIYKGKSELNMKFCHLFNLNITKGGYHSYIDPTDYWHEGGPVVRCIIPKGSLYLENDLCYCSTAIKVVEIV